MTTMVTTIVGEAGIRRQLLTELRRAADHVPAYRILLEEQGVNIDEVDDLQSFARVCPLLTKANTFERFRLADLSVGGALGDVADVLTSSGAGGGFSFGVISRTEARAGGSFIDAALETTFAVATKRTLLINCLPMGVIFSSNCMTVATTGVREDIVVALVRAVEDQYEQIILAVDVLFMKRLLDFAASQGLAWPRDRVKVFFGGGMFGEQFRGYVAQCFGISEDALEGGAIMSSFGVGELGLHLCFETPATVALRRAAAAHPAFAAQLFGGAPRAGQPLPLILAFNARRTFIEIVEPDRHGYGRLTISMLDPDRSVPLLRYQTGDVARLLDRSEVEAAIRRHGGYSGGGDDLPPTLVALQGRDTDVLPNGSHVSFYRDALYVDRQLAHLLSGAFRLIFRGPRFSMHVQLVRGQAPDAVLEARLLATIPTGLRPAQVVLWPYAAFPYGMALDYQRKFSHYVPGEPDVAV
jgi:phenylacetate-CoA ligase